MKPFAKGALVSIGAQVALCIVLGLITSLLSPKAAFVGGFILYVYYPTIFGIWKIHYFIGEANSFMPILLGVPLGILLYGAIFGCLFNYLKKDSRRSSR